MTHANEHPFAANQKAPPGPGGKLLRAAAVLGTFWLLVAESPPPICGDGLGPETFLVTGDCGPPGLVTLSVNECDRVIVDNGASLGFAEYEPNGWLNDSDCPSSMSKANFELWGEAVGNPATSVGDASPDAGAGLAPGLSSEGHDGAASDPDGGLDAGVSAAPRARLVQGCSVSPEGDALVARCTPEFGDAPACKSTLKPWAGQP